MCLAAGCIVCVTRLPLSAFQQFSDSINRQIKLSKFSPNKHKPITIENIEEESKKMRKRIWIARLCSLSHTQCRMKVRVICELEKK